MLHPDTIQFLIQLKENNNKAWFDAHKEWYNSFKHDYHRLADALVKEMIHYDQNLEGLTTRDTTFRIYRDVRFSTNKTPYKTQLGIVLQCGGKKSPLCAYYLHIEYGKSHAGGGLWMPESKILNRARKEIYYFYEEFRDIVDAPDFKYTFGELEEIPGQKLSRPPKGYDINNPAIEYLKHKSLIASKSIPDTLLTSDKLIPSVIDIFRVLQPMIAFINRGILSDENGGL